MSDIPNAETPPDPKVRMSLMLARIEGQVRGLRQMVEADRGTGDKISGINTIVDALRDFALETLSRALDTRIDRMFTDAAVEDIAAVRELVQGSFRSPTPR